MKQSMSKDERMNFPDKTDVTFRMFIKVFILTSPYGFVLYIYNFGFVVQIRFRR